MKNLFKSLLLATATVAAVSTSQAANGDLLAGFDRGTGNTLVFNLGSYASLFDGKTWDVSAALVAAGFNGVNPAAGITFGVIGYQNSGSTIFSTVNPVDGGTDFNGARSAIAGMTSANGTQSRGSGVDWFTETESPFGFGTWFANTLDNPNGTQGDYLRLQSYALDTPSQTSALNFTLDTAGTLTYTSVPEPSTVGLLGGLGLLALGFRRRFVQA